MPLTIRASRGTMLRVCSPAAVFGRPAPVSNAPAGGASIEALVISPMTCCHPGVGQLCHTTELTSWVADTPLHPHGGSHGTARSRFWHRCPGVIAGLPCDTSSAAHAARGRVHTGTDLLRGTNASSGQFTRVGLPFHPGAPLWWWVVVRGRTPDSMMINLRPDRRGMAEAARI